MCGIVGAIATRNVLPILIDGLQRLEYRGYDSAGVAVRESSGELKRFRSLGKVEKLRAVVDSTDVEGDLGIARQASRQIMWAVLKYRVQRRSHEMES